uniref:Aminotran_1_2 domain-containing protein n=1 Tax=Steinernema glaseri TaxID=37863 RepID=A0A1I8AE09_9BILA
MIGLILYLTERLSSLFFFVYGTTRQAALEAPPADPPQEEKSGRKPLPQKFCCKNCRDSLSTVPTERVEGANEDPSWVTFFTNWKNASTTSASTKRKRKTSKAVEGPMADRIATRAQRLLVGADNATAAYKEVYVDQWHPTENPQGNVNLCTAENNLCDDLLHEKLEANCSRLKPDEARISHYPVPGGYESTKEAAKRYLEHFHNASELRTEHMILTPGCTAAYDMLSYCLCQPGDVVLSAAPFYGRLFNNFEERGQAEVVPVPYKNVMNPHLDIEEFEKSARFLEEEGKRVKVIVIINPNNPLGVVFPREQVVRLCNWAATKKIHVIIDEVFASSVYEHSTQFESFLSYRGQVDTANVTYMWGFGKDLCLPGLKFALVYSESEQIIKTVRRLEIMQPCAPCVQHIAEVLLEDLEWLETFHKEKNSRLLRNKNFLCAMLNKLRIDYVPCTAAFTVYIDLRRYMVDASFKGELQLWLELCCAGVFISPGQFMGGAEPGWFRIVFSGDREALIEGLRRFEVTLGQLSKKKCAIPVLPRIDTNPLLGPMTIPSPEARPSQKLSIDTHPEEPEPSIKRELSGWDFGESNDVSKNTDPNTLDIYSNKKKRVSWVDIEGVARSLEAATKAYEAAVDERVKEDTDVNYQLKIRKNSDTRRASLDFITELVAQGEAKETKNGDGVLSAVFERPQEEAQAEPVRKPTIAEVQKYDHSYISQFIMKSTEEKEVVEPSKTDFVVELLSKKPEMEGEELQKNNLLDAVFSVPEAKNTSTDQEPTKKPSIDTSFVASLVEEKMVIKEEREDIPLDKVFSPGTPPQGSEQLKTEAPKKITSAQKGLDLTPEPTQPSIDTSFISDLVREAGEEQKTTSTEVSLEAVFAHQAQEVNTNEDKTTDKTKIAVAPSQEPTQLVQKEPPRKKVASNEKTVDLNPEPVQPSIDTSFIRDLVGEKAVDDYMSEVSLDSVFVKQPEDQKNTETKIATTSISLDDVFASKTTENEIHPQVEIPKKKTTLECNALELKPEPSQPSIDTSFIADLVKEDKEVVKEQLSVDAVFARQESKTQSGKVYYGKALSVDESSKASEVQKQAREEKHESSKKTLALEPEPVQPSIDTSFIADLVMEKQEEGTSDALLESVFTKRTIETTTGSTVVTKTVTVKSYFTVDSGSSGQTSTEITKEQGREEHEQQANHGHFIVESATSCLEPVMLDREAELVAMEDSGIDISHHHSVTLTEDHSQQSIDTSFIADLVACRPEEKKDNLLDTVFSGAASESFALPEPLATSTLRKEKKQKVSVADETLIVAEETVEEQKEVKLEPTEPAKAYIDTSFVADLLKEEHKKSKLDTTIVRADINATPVQPESVQATYGTNQKIVKLESKEHRLSLKTEPPQQTIDTSFIADMMAQKCEDEKVENTNVLDSVFALPSTTPVTNELGQESNLLDSVFVGTKAPSPEREEVLEKAEEAVEEPKPVRKVTIEEVQRFDHSYIDQFLASAPQKISIQETTIQHAASNLIESIVDEKPAAPEKPARTYTETELAASDSVQCDEVKVESEGATPKGAINQSCVTAVEVYKDRDDLLESVFPAPETEKRKESLNVDVTEQREMVVVGKDDSAAYDEDRKETLQESYAEQKDEPKVELAKTIESDLEYSSPGTSIDASFIANIVAQDTVSRASSEAESDILAAVFDKPQLSQAEKRRHLVHQDSVRIIRKHRSRNNSETLHKDIPESGILHEALETESPSDAKLRVKERSKKVSISETEVVVVKGPEEDSQKAKHVEKCHKRVSISAMKPVCIGVHESESDEDKRDTVSTKASQPEPEELASSTSPIDADLAESGTQLKRYGRKLTIEEVEVYNSSYIDKFVIEKPRVRESSLSLEEPGLQETKAIDVSFVEEMVKKDEERHDGAAHHAVPLKEEFAFIDNLVKATRKSKSFEEDSEIIEKVFGGMSSLKRVSEPEVKTYEVKKPFEESEEIFKDIADVEIKPERPSFLIHSEDAPKEVLKTPEASPSCLTPSREHKPRKLSKIASASDLSKKERELLVTEISREKPLTPDDDELLESVFSTFKPSLSTQISQMDEESTDSAEVVEVPERKLSAAHDRSKKEEELLEMERSREKKEHNAEEEEDGSVTPLPSRSDNMHFELPEESLVEAVRKAEEEEELDGSESDSAPQEAPIPQIDVSFVEELVRRNDVISPGAFSMDSGIVAPQSRITFDESASSSNCSFHKESSDSETSVLQIPQPNRDASLTNFIKFEDASSETSSIRPASPLNRACEEYETLLNHVFSGATAPPEDRNTSKVHELRLRDDGFQQHQPETPETARNLTITTDIPEDSVTKIEVEGPATTSPKHDGQEHHAVPLEEKFGFIDELVKETKESKSFEQDHDIIEKVFTGMSSLKRRQPEEHVFQARKIEPQFTINISRVTPEEEAYKSKTVVEIDPNDGLLDLVFSTLEDEKKEKKKAKNEGEVVVEKVDVTQIVYDSKSLQEEPEKQDTAPERSHQSGSFIQSLLLNSLLVTLPESVASSETIERISSEPIYPFRCQDDSPCPTKNHIYYHIVPNKDDPSELSMETIAVPKRLHLIQQQAETSQEDKDTVDNTTQTTHVLIEVTTKDEAIQESQEQREVGIQTTKHVGFHCQITVIPPKNHAERYFVEPECHNEKHMKDSDHCQTQYRIKQSSMTPTEKILGKTDKLYMTKDKTIGQWVISAVCRSTPYGYERSSLAAKGYAPAPPLPDVIETTRK